MPDWKRRLLGLGIPCLLAWAFDVGMTFHGQPEAYWSGDYSLADEGSPMFAMLFKMHPLAAAAGEVFWLGIIITWLLLMPESIAVVLTVVIVFGHSAGGYTWFGFLLQSRWFQTLYGVVFVSAAVLGVGLHWFLWTSPRQVAVVAAPGLRPAVRWSLLAIATALAAYIYLVPQ